MDETLPDIVSNESEIYKTMSEEEIQRRILEVDNFKTQDEHDLDVAEKYGSLPAKMKDRKHLTRQKATFFIFSYFYRRLIFAILIMAFYTYSVIQIITVMMLNLLYFSLIVSLWPFKSQRE